MSKPTKHFGKWRIRWIDECGTRRSEVHEKCEDAKDALVLHEAYVVKLKHGRGVPIDWDKTFNDLCDYYLEHYTVLKRRKRDDHSLIKNHLRPFFGTHKLGVIYDKIDEFKSSRAHYHPSTLHHQLTLLITMLRVARSKRWLQEVPIIKKPKLRLFDKDFDYLRSEEEIRKFLDSAFLEGRFPYAIYSLAVFTGLRPGEQAGLSRSDISLDRRLISVQRSYDGPTKTSEVRYVPILDPLLPVLRDWLSVDQGPILFPNSRGRMLNEKSRIFDEVFKRVLNRAGFPKVQKKGKQRAYIRYYDLRHTFASMWMRNGGDLFKLSKVLGHKTTQMTHRYVHFQPDVFREDYGRLGTFTPANTDNVIPIGTLLASQSSEVL